MMKKRKRLVKFGTVKNLTILTGLGLFLFGLISFYFTTQPEEVCAQGCFGTNQESCGGISEEDCFGTPCCEWVFPGKCTNPACSSMNQADCIACEEYCSWEAITTTTTTIPVGHADGIALYYYTGERVDGNVTVIPVENSENKTSPTNFTNGEWSVDFDMITSDVLYLTFIIDDNEKIGYNQLKLDNDNPSTATLNCSTQNISVSGYSVDVSSGTSITSGNLRVSILDADYMNTSSFSGTWSIDFHPCLISGRIYTLQILISDDTGKRGEILQKYPAR